MAASTRTSIFLGSGFSEPDDFALLQYAQELILYVHGDVADLIEKERSHVGGFEQPLVIFDRSREGAAFMAE